MKTQRIQVRRRRFGFKVGLTFLAVREYGKDSKLSFAVPRSEVIERRALRELILQKIEQSNGRFFNGK